MKHSHIIVTFATLIAACACPVETTTPPIGCACDAPPHTIAVCVSESDDGGVPYVCEHRGCEPGWIDCDGNAKTGCETNGEIDGNCGVCGVTCADGQRCGPGCGGDGFTCYPSTTNCPDAGGLPQ